jgi:hypothetical protein
VRQRRAEIIKLLVGLTGGNEASSQSQHVYQNDDELESKYKKEYALNDTFASMTSNNALNTFPYYPPSNSRQSNESDSAHLSFVSQKSNDSFNRNLNFEKSMNVDASLINEYKSSVDREIRRMTDQYKDILTGYEEHRRFAKTF